MVFVVSAINNANKINHFVVFGFLSLLCFCGSGGVEKSKDALRNLFNASIWIIATFNII